jgi:pimeloyl-ACP methyl ester carboxylesterase
MPSQPARDTLILIPGLLCDARVWRSQIAALSGLIEVRVSDHALQDSLPDMARTLIDSAPPRFAVAGHSMGGRIALEVLRAAPDRVTGVALLDTGQHPLPAGEAGEKEAAGRFQLLETARRDGMRAMARTWVQGMVHPTRLDDRELLDSILDMFESKSPDMYAAQIRALLHRPDAAPLLPTIRVPTLVLCGHEDVWSPLQRHVEIAAAIPGATLVDIPTCGHMSTMERPDAVSAALRAWLEQVMRADGNARAGGLRAQSSLAGGRA